MVLLDHSAVFDSVDHDLFLAELNLICLRGISTSANIRDLGVQLDSKMSMAVHVSRTCQTAYAQLRGIARIRSFLPLSACKTFVHAFITSRLDFGNGALYGFTGTLLRRLEMVLLSTARVVICLRRRDQPSMTAAQQELHWLPVAQRIQYKLLTLMQGAVHANTLRYLADRISPYVLCRNLLSAEQSIIVAPMVNLERLGRQAFARAGPTVWNSLPIWLITQSAYISLIVMLTFIVLSYAMFYCNNYIH